MGDPRKIRRQYSRPQHPWREERITEEDALCKKYGLKNRREVWKVIAKVRKMRKETRDLLAMENEQATKQEKDLLLKLRKLGMEVKTLEDVLALRIEDLLERRLESIVYRKGLANTAKQARQFVIHGHVLIGDKVVSIPSYLVAKDEENEVRRKEKINIAPPTKREKREEVKGGRRRERNRRR